MSSVTSSTPPRTPVTPRRSRKQAPASSSSPTALTSRKPLGERRIILSPQAFQEQHATYFAHLHLHEDDDDAVRREKLEAERARLEEERRVGRELRRSLMEKRSEMRSKTPDEGMQPMEGRGWRPLNLVQRRQESGHARSASHQATSTTIRAPPRPASHNVGSSSTRTTSLSLAPASVPTRRSVSDNSAPALQQQLEVVREREGSVPPEVLLDTDSTFSGNESLHSTGNDSIAKSTYSWATEFSGETEELRQAAHYVRTSFEDGDGDGDAEEVPPSDTPQKVKQRRKRIVAIAHTVRQLEGVGSRDVEDPTLYQTLVKAWHARPGNGPPPPLIQPSALTDGPPPLFAPPNSASTSGNGGMVALPSPDLPLTHSSTAGIRYGRYSDLAPAAFSNAFRSHFSPPDPEVRTPLFDTSTFTAAQYAESSTAPMTRNPSVRYSYASTLHDLAMEGGFEQGATLMSEKAWLRSENQRWSNAFDARPPSGFFPPGAERPASIPPPPIFANEARQPHTQPLAQSPERKLRRHKGNVAREAARPVDLSPVHDDAMIAPPPLSQGGWGLGFVSDWWTGRDGGQIEQGQPHEQESGQDQGQWQEKEWEKQRMQEQEQEQCQQDFHQGEDGIPAEKETRASRLSGDAEDQDGSVSDPLSLRLASRQTDSASDAERPTNPALAQMSSEPKPEMPTTQEEATGYPSSNPCLPANSSIPSTTFCHSPPPPVVSEEPPAPDGPAVPPSCHILAISSSPLETAPRLRPRPHTLLPEPARRSLRPDRRSSLPLAQPSSVPIPSTRPRPLDPYLYPYPNSNPAPHPNSPSSLTTRHHDYDPLSCPVSSPDTPGIDTDHSDHYYVPRREISPPSTPLSAVFSPVIPNSISSPLGTTTVSPDRVPLTATHLAPTHIAPAKVRPSRATQALFFLGFLMPWCWVFGGWPVYRTRARQADIEHGLLHAHTPAAALARAHARLQARTSPRSGSGMVVSAYWKAWVDHPDPWARRCRVGATMVMPPLILGGVAALIVLAVKG
ncbi:hypothetical protein JCM24511_06075 [Saitozyma sp. JCM 24511]|nr:hypothetical protein JCM24511_06075 [Saitozyma sp. JCM 24511]